MKKLLTRIVGATLGLALAIGVSVGAANNGEAKGVYADYSSLYSADFTSVAAHSYTQNKTFTLSNKSWKSSVSQVSASVFYLGCNSGASAYGILNDNSDFSEIVTALKAADSKYNTTYATAHAYALLFENAYNNVTKVNFSWAGGNNAFQVYLFGYTGSQWTKLANTNYATSGQAVSGEVNWTGSATNYTKFAVAARPGTSSTTATNKTLRASSFTVYETIVPAGTYTVTFDSNGGSDISAQNVSDSGTAKATEPSPAPTKNGYDFVAWYTQEEYPDGTPYDFNTPVTGDLGLKAKWAEKALTANYSSTGVNALTNGQGYHISGEVTAKCSTKAFFIQSGNNAMQIYDDTTTVSSAVSVGNTVDVYGTYQDGNNAELKDILYYHVTSNDTTLSQTPLTSLNDATEANRFKYFEIAQIQLNSAFNNSNQAQIKNSSVVLYYASANYVNVGSSFNKGDYAANDYVSIKGVVEKYNSTIELKITYISKLSQYTVTFESNGGTAVPSQSVLQGNTAEQPANPTKASDENYTYAFAGWYTNPELTGDAYDFDLPVNAALTLYAKWNRSDRDAKDVVANLNTQSSLAYHYSKSGNGAVDTLNKTFTGISGSAYTDWSDKTGESGVVYAGNSYGNSTAIQLNTGTTYYQGIVTTGNPNSNNIKKITIDWASNTAADRYVEVYGKNEAYSSTENLYDNNEKGTLVTSLTCNSNHDDSEYTFVADYKYIGIKASGALYIDSIDIQWGDLPSYAFSNVSIRFSNLISTSLWTRLNTESSIQGYGVMLATPETLGSDPIEDWYAIADGNSYEEKIAYLATGNVKNFYMPLSTKSPDLANSAQKAGAEGDHYIWYLNKIVLDTEEGLTKEQVKAKLTQRYTAVGYVKTVEGLVFLDQVAASAAGLADAAITGGQATTSTANGSLKNLADMLA